MTPGDLFLVVGSFLPGLLYLWLVARTDRAHRNPRRYVYGVYALGMFSVVPAVFLEMAGIALFFDDSGRLSQVLMAFLLIGPVEEVCKFLAVRSIAEGPHFEDPLDGVVYASAAAMGFASLENAFYVAELGWETFWLRALLAIPGHLVFSALWGYQLGKQKFGLGGNLVQGLGAAAFLHGLYDALLMAGVAWLSFAVVPLVAAMLFIFRRQVRELWSLARSWEAGAGHGNQRLLQCRQGHRFAVDFDACGRCGDRSLSLVCARCGRPTSWRQEACGSCRTPFDDHAVRCARCGDPYPPHLARCPFCGWAVAGVDQGPAGGVGATS